MPAWRTAGPSMNPLTFPELLERDAERAALAGCLEAAAAGRGSCVLVRGPAGIGKSALLAEARGLAEAAGLRVAAARGSELERSFAFGAVQQLFAREMRGLGGAAAHAAGALAVQSAEPNHAVLHGLYWLAADLAPLAIVVDDAHWVDPPSLRWLNYLVNRVEELAVAVVLAERTGEPVELLTRIALHPAATVLAPAPLSHDAVRRLAAATLGREPDEAFVRAAAEATQGNPFYLRALLAEGETPASVVESVTLRLERLPAPCARLARALAVLDGAASGTVAARLAGLDLRDTVQAAEALAAADLVQGGAFVHPLVRDAVYAAIPQAERAEAHARAARLLADAGAPPEPVAAQLMAGEPGEGEWAVEALRRAARAAWARGAADVAAGFLHRAREEEMPAALRVAVLRELAPAVTATEGPGGLPYLYEALGLAAPEERPAIARKLARSLFIQGFSTEAATVLERHAPALREELATLAVFDLGVLRSMGGLDAIAAGVPGAPVAAWIEVARRPPAARGAERAEAALAAPLEDRALAAALVALRAAGRLEQADAIWTGVADAARAAGALERLRFAVALRALVRVRMGRVAAAEADLRELIAWTAELEVPFPDQRVALPWAVVPLTDALVERGRLEEAQGWMSRTGLEADWPEVFGFTFLLDCLGRLRLGQGRTQEAVGRRRECTRRERPWGIRTPGFLPWRSSLALALARTGRRTEALDLCDEEIHLARAFGVAREEGMALRALGTIAGDTEALEQAVAVLDPSPARLEHARAL